MSKYSNSKYHKIQNLFKILCKNIIKKNFSKVTKIKMNDKLFLDLAIPYAFRLQPKNIIISVNKNLAIHHQTFFKIKYNVKLQLKTYN